MRATDLDRRITFMAKVEGARTGLNAAPPSWTEAGGTGQGKRWAQKIDARDSQRQAAQRQAQQGVADVVTCWFRVRRDSMTAARAAGDRIAFDRVTYEIRGVKEVQDDGARRGAFLEFSAVAVR